MLLIRAPSARSPCRFPAPLGPGRTDPATGSRGAGIMAGPSPRTDPEDAMSAKKTARPARRATTATPPWTPRRRRWTWHPRKPGHALRRRGVAHGVVRGGRSAIVAGTPRELWAAAEPLHFPGVLASALAAARDDVRRTRSLFERLGESRSDFADHVWRRLSGQRRFIAGGASRDLADPREIQKVHADRVRGGRAADLWAKLSWISRDERDPSLRIRFSFGSELADDWSHSLQRARAADELAEAVFPECRVLARNVSALRWLRRATGGAVRLSERILFANAPGGGAAFHHDAETDQLGVAYAQLAGRTAWLALPKRELAALISTSAPSRALARGMRTPQRALRTLERPLPALDRLLNSDPRLTRDLAEAGRLYVLSAGDVLFLPSPGPDDVAWHSVFALGTRPSLALSFGIFRDRRTRR